MYYARDTDTFYGRFEMAFVKPVKIGSALQEALVALVTGNQFDTDEIGRRAEIVYINLTTLRYGLFP